MNNILKSDYDCNYRQLSIRTFQVIPLTDKVGMIEFIKNTEKLGNFLCTFINNETLNKARNEYDVWLNKALPNGEMMIMKKYLYSCLAYDSNAATAKMIALTNSIPSDSVRYKRTFRSSTFL